MSLNISFLDIIVILYRNTIIQIKISFYIFEGKCIFEMNDVFCPKCGKIHKSANRHCDHCGEDLEFVILKFKQKHLPVKYKAEPPPLDEDKASETQKNITEYIKTEAELEEYDILPENLTRQPLTNTYTQAAQIQTTGKFSRESQRLKLQKKRDPWWFDCFWC